MEREEVRSSRQASPRTNARGATASIARHGELADLRDRLWGLVCTLALWLLCVAVGTLMAWCVMCPDHQPVSRAEWEAMEARGVLG